jgi:cysteine desulfurase/selenocysteine lyase
MKGRDVSGGSRSATGGNIRANFPIFAHQERVEGARSIPFAYLDSAASTQKHSSVIARLSQYLSCEHANIHRGAYRLSAEATRLYDEAREKVARFLGAAPRNIIFTRGTTESVNLVASALRKKWRHGDVILLSYLEHHSNIVPWQMIADQVGMRVEFVDIDPHARLEVNDFLTKLAQLRPALVSLTALSNAFGTLLPVRDLVREARAMGALTMVDGAQIVAHAPVDVSEIGCDFFAFSGHKLYGPTGIGALYVRDEAYDYMEPYQGGGDMIQTVTVNGSTWADVPQRFEAGTPAIAEAIALGAAVDMLTSIGWQAIQAHERELFDAAWQLLSQESGVSLYGPRTARAAGDSGKSLQDQASILPFNVEGVHPHDLSSIADDSNVQIRAGHHCAMPALARLGLQSTARASIGIYSERADFEQLIEAIRKAKRIFGRA